MGISHPVMGFLFCFLSCPRARTHLLGVVLCSLQPMKVGSSHDPPPPPLGQLSWQQQFPVLGYDGGPGMGQETDCLWDGGCLDCPEGRWGLGCQEICPACEHGAACEPGTGACLCRPGYVGSRCQDSEYGVPQPAVQSALRLCPQPPLRTYTPWSRSVPSRLVWAWLPDEMFLRQ